jgi:hypothetical protein
VGLGIVLRGVSERSVDAAFGSSGVASDGVDLREKRDVGARVVRLDRRPHARAAGADDEDVVLRLHYEGSYRMAVGCRFVTELSPGRALDAPG